MFNLFLYIITIQWSPGPLNILALNSGLQGRVKETLKFCLGVGLAMTLQFSLCGYASQWIINPYLMPLIAGIGSLYIMWLAYHMIKPSSTHEEKDTITKPLTFHDGLIMQLINPKGFVAALPVATIYFPSLGIVNLQILIFAIIFGIICIGSVLFYTVLGHYFSKWITQPGILKKCNIVMGVLLFLLAFSLDWEYIIAPLLS